MKTIITLTGHKNCGKTIIAERFAKNSDAVWIQPYTDAPVPNTAQYSKNINVDYHYVRKERLDKIIENQKILCCTRINGHRYVFFESQLTAGFNIMIVDDYALVDVKSRWKGNIYTIRVVSKNEIESDRIGEYFYKHEFDEVFDYDTGDYEELEARIDHYVTWSEKTDD